MAYKTIAAPWIVPPRPSDDINVMQIFDAMAEMERDVLGFLDPVFSLLYDYGSSNLPDKLPEGKFPLVVHLPRNSGEFRSITTMGGSSLLGHPGGIREHLYPFAIYWLVGVRASNIDKLMVDSSFWCKAVDMAYCANPGLGGAVKEIGLSSYYWGDLRYGETTYFGWIFNGTARKQYSFQGGG